jgi:hypothetical protein
MVPGPGESRSAEMGGTLQGHYNQNVDVTRVENDNALAQFRNAALENDLVQIFSGGEQVHPSVFHNPHDLKVAARRNAAGGFARSYGDSAPNWLGLGVPIVESGSKIAEFLVFYCDHRLSA